MGKRRKIMGRLISRWMKSDLPDDRSTVLLLGVARIPPSPGPGRRGAATPLVEDAPVDAAVEAPAGPPAGHRPATEQPDAVAPPPRPPSYLGLARTVNGYSPTTNYDPERLAAARPRDSPPHAVPLPRAMPSAAVSAAPSAPADAKSFIQQRVERLYGPGALAHGFFATKRARGRSCDERRPAEDGDDDGMRQSWSAPSLLPVLRHLRPEFRAQLPIAAGKRRAAPDGPAAPPPSVPALPEEDESGEEEPETPVNGRAAMNCGFGRGGGGGGGAKRGAADARERTRHGTAAARDGHYFVGVLEREAGRLLAMAAGAEAELEASSPDLDEDARGFLRSAAGKARLLVTQKMQQFRGLCRNNVTQVAGEAFPTTDEDLQGFWDMVMLQVRQVDELFAEIERMRENGWREEHPAQPAPGAATPNGQPPARRSAKPAPRPLSAAAEENRRAREAQRKRLIEERRRAMKEQRGLTAAAPQQQRHPVEIYAPPPDAES